MYTLEDDNETSSRYKRNMLNQQGHHDVTQKLETEQEPTISPGQGEVTHTLPATPPSSREALAALTIACISVFFTALDQTVVVTALPDMITDLNIPITQLDRAAWIISAYLLGFVVAMPLMGRVSDLYGRRRIFLLCLAIFGVGSIFCGLAPWLGEVINLQGLSRIGIDTSSPGLNWLIVARVIQAIGGGAIVPVAMAIASDFYGQEKRGIALGIIGAVTEAGGAVGPLYGAVLVETLGWKSIFYLNVPIVIALMVAAWFLIPRGQRLYEGIDWLGATLLALALTCLSLGLAQQGTSLGPMTTTGSASQSNPLVLVLSVVFFIAFILVERKAHWPIIELAHFKRLAFSANALVSLLVGAALIIAMTDIPIFMDTVLRTTTWESGLALLRLTVMIPIGAVLGGWLCERLTCRVTGVIGLTVTAAGFFFMSRWPLNVDWTQITLATCVAGFGFGLVIAPIGTTAINVVRPSQAGVSSAVITALRMVGMMLGLAMLTSWALSYFRQLAAAYGTLPKETTLPELIKWLTNYEPYLIRSAHTVYSAVFFVSMILCVIAIIPACFLWGRKAPTAEGNLEQLADANTVLVGQQQITSYKTFTRKSLLASLALIFIVCVSSAVAGYAMARPVSTPVTPTGARTMNLALNKEALTSIFQAQLHQQQGPMKNLRVTPRQGNELLITMDMTIGIFGVTRDIPVEVIGKIGLDEQKNLQITVKQFKRAGIDAGQGEAKNMEKALNQMLTTSVMPELQQALRGTKIVDVYTDNKLGCSKGEFVLVLKVEAPAINGIDPQQLPETLCFLGPVDLKNVLP